MWGWSGSVSGVDLGKGCTGFVVVSYYQREKTNRKLSCIFDGACNGREKEQKGELVKEVFRKRKNKLKKCIL